jgi:hypothetical protein
MPVREQPRYRSGVNRRRVAVPYDLNERHADDRPTTIPAPKSFADRSSRI